MILLALGVILLLGLLGLTQGSMLTPLIQVVDRGFGWGGFLVVAFISALGLFALRRRKQIEPVFPDPIVIAIGRMGVQPAGFIHPVWGPFIRSSRTGDRGADW